MGDFVNKVTTPKYLLYLPILLFLGSLLISVVYANGNDESANSGLIYYKDNKLVPYEYHPGDYILYSFASGPGERLFYVYATATDSPLEGANPNTEESYLVEHSSIVFRTIARGADGKEQVKYLVLESREMPGQNKQRPGVQVNNLLLRQDSWPLAQAHLLKFKSSLDGEKLDKLQELAFKVAGKKFDLYGTVTEPFAPLFPKRPGKEDSLPRKFFCSDLITWTSQQIGTLPKGSNPKKISPPDLFYRRLPGMEERYEAPVPIFPAKLEAVVNNKKELVSFGDAYTCRFSRAGGKYFTCSNFFGETVIFSLKKERALFGQIDRITRDDPARLIIYQPGRPIGFYKPKSLTTIIGTKQVIHFRQQTEKKLPLKK